MCSFARLLLISWVTWVLESCKATLIRELKVPSQKNDKGKKLPTSTIGGCQVVPDAQYTGQSRTMVRQTCVNHGAAMIFMSGIENAIQLWSFLFLLDQTPITNHPKDTPPPEHGMLKWKSPLWLWNGSFGYFWSTGHELNSLTLFGLWLLWSS